jgi:hypothetical protein
MISEKWKKAWKEKSKNSKKDNKDDYHGKLVFIDRKIEIRKDQIISSNYKEHKRCDQNPNDQKVIICV